MAPLEETIEFVVASVEGHDAMVGTQEGSGRRTVGLGRILRASPASGIVIVGAGIAGLAAAAALRKFEIDSVIYDQAKGFARVGAGIQLTPNAMKAVRGFGLEDRLRAVSFAPELGYNRQWDTGEVTFVHPMGEIAKMRTLGAANHGQRCDAEKDGNESAHPGEIPRVSA